MNDHPIFKKLRLAWTLVMLVLLGACGGGTPPEPISPTSVVNAVMGPLGGTVTGPDGVQVVIPLGALSQLTTIGIAKSSVGAPTLPAGYPPAGAVYEFTPHDIVFALPVTIRMPVPSGALGTGVFMASPGEDWGFKDAYNNNGMAEFERNSFSWAYGAGSDCRFNRNDPDLDPSGCVIPSGYASASATPTAALTRNIVMLNAQPTLSPVPSAGSYTLHQTAMVRLKLVYTVGENCINNTVTINRREIDANGPGTFGPAQTLYGPSSVQAGMTFSGGTAPGRSASGSTTVDVAFTSADSGKKYWFGLKLSCNKSGQPTVNYGDALVIDVATLAPPTVTNTVGGAVSGLTGTGLVLQNNGADNLAVSANGAITFAMPSTVGDPYSVTVLTQPSGQICTVTNGSGTVQGNVANVAVTCVATNYTLYRVGGYASYKNKGAVVLQNNGTDTITVNADYSYSFPTKIMSGSPYNVTVLTAPAGQTCQVINASGISSSAFSQTTVDVTCTDNGLALVANSGANTLSVYSTNGATGALTPLGTAAAGPSPYAIAIEPCDRYPYVNGNIDPYAPLISYAFASNPSANSLSSYTISASKGTATLVANSGIYSPNPHGIAVYPTCAGWVYAVNYSNNTVSAFAVDVTNGALAGLGTPVATGLNPYAIVVHPNGKFAYVANEAGNSVSAYQVESTGALTPVAGTLASSVMRPHSLVVDRSYKFLHVASTDSNNVTTFSIDPVTGALTAVVGTVTTGISPDGIAVHPSGQFLYTANSGSSDISIFNIDSATGMLTAVGTVAAGSGPTEVVIGLGGKVLYASNKTANSTSVFSVNASTGALTPQGAAVGTGTGPDGIAITP
jgi:6-phosphogluconolactonase (cycloisomerase 2 family)